jgi:hypothetical protein
MKVHPEPPHLSRKLCIVQLAVFSPAPIVLFLHLLLDILLLHIIIIVIIIRFLLLNMMAICLLGKKEKLRKKNIVRKPSSFDLFFKFLREIHSFDNNRREMNSAMQVSVEKNHSFWQVESLKMGNW